MQLLISKCSQANGKWTDQFTRNWDWLQEAEGKEVIFILPFAPSKNYSFVPHSRLFAFKI